MQSKRVDHLLQDAVASGYHEVAAKARKDVPMSTVPEDRNGWSWGSTLFWLIALSVAGAITGLIIEGIAG